MIRLAGGPLEFVPGEEFGWAAEEREYLLVARVRLDEFELAFLVDPGAALFEVMFRPGR